MDSELHDECGVFGYFCPDETRNGCCKTLLFRFIALQHRGQDKRRASLSIITASYFVTKKKGLVVEVLTILPSIC